MSDRHSDRAWLQARYEKFHLRLRHALHRGLRRILTLGAIALFTCLITLGQACQTPNLFASSDSAELAEREAQCENRADFAWVPSGDFISGSDRTERDAAYRMSAEAWAEISALTAGSDEIPVSVSTAEQNLRQRQWFDREPEQEERASVGFCIHRNLVTNADYLEFVNATGHRSPDISADEYQEQGFLVHPYDDVEPYRWQSQPQPAFPEGKAQHPVVLVNYDDAIAYAQWRGQQDGGSYRLPTALEWEKAARGTDGRYFPWGNEWQNDATNWIGRKHFGDGVEGTSAIAIYPLSRSVYGVEDMAGNVFEYTSTLLERGDRTVSVMKGCSWDDLPGFCRAAYRHTRPTDSRHILFGFRLVLR